MKNARGTRNQHLPNIIEDTMKISSWTVAFFIEIISALVGAFFNNESVVSLASGLFVLTGIGYLFHYMLTHT